MTDSVSRSRDARLGRPVKVTEVAAGGIVSRPTERRLTVVLSILALLLGLLQAWETRFTIGRDAVSYLDMGDAYFRRDWSMALNGYFNPLYAWILGFVMHGIRPGPYWEYPLVHLVDFLIYGFALYAFSRFLRELLGFRNTLSRDRGGPQGILHHPGWAWIVLGYSIFLWSSLDLINSYKGEVTQKGPDMLVAAFVYLAAALLLRVRNGYANWLTFALLGAICGLGYLTKAVFFPLGLILLAVGLFVVGDLRRALPRIGLSFLVFALLAGPYVLALSSAKRRLTFGDTGRLNYAWYVNGTAVRHWQGSPETGTPRHPTRELLRRPATYEFATPVGGTYPVWYDASYWYEGLRIRFSARRQLRVLIANLRELGTFWLRLNGGLFFGLLLLAVTAHRPRALLKDVGSYWFLIVPCAAALGSYALVTMESRYVGAFVAIIALSAFCGIRLRDTPETRRLFGGLAIALLSMVLLPIGPSSIPHGYGSLFHRGSADSSAPWRVASEVRKIGIRPGDGVAAVQYSKRSHIAWARLARVRIIGEVFYSPTMEAASANNFFRASPIVQDQIIRAFRQAGAKLIVSDEAPPAGLLDSRSEGNWRRLGETDLYVSSPDRGIAAAPRGFRDGT